MSAKAKSNIVHDLKKEADAAAALRQYVVAQIGNDEDTILVAFEGETNLYEVGEWAMERLITIQALRAGIAAAKARLTEPMDVRDNRLAKQEAAIRAALHGALLTAGLPSLELPIATVTDKALAASCEIEDEGKIPSKYWKDQPKPDPKIDKVLVLADLKTGVAVAGAKLIDDKRTVNIRFK